jgi:hypothetical protein
MSDEIRAAAVDAVRELENCSCDQERGRFVVGPAMKVVRAYLAANPGDGDEPVNHDFLIAMGFSTPQADAPFGWYSRLLPPANEGAAITELCVTNDGEFEFQLKQGYPDEPNGADDFVSLTSIKTPTTRAQLRNLLAALGVA